MSTRILLVDPDSDHAEWLVRSLTPIHWTVTMVDTAADALATLSTTQPDCIVTELALPDHPGGLIWVGELLKNKSSITPLMVCSANLDLDLQTRVLALRMGADGVLGKPFDVDLFVANVEALIRNAQARRLDLAREIDEAAARPPVIVGPLEINRHEASIDGQRIHLTPTEFRLLRVIAENYPQTVGYRECLTTVWGPNEVLDSWRASLQTHKGRLSLKLQPRFRLVSVRGWGYRLELDHHSSSP